VIKDRLTSEEAEERKRKLLQSAADAASAREYDDAVRILEDARREFSETKEIELLLQRVRAAQTKEMSVVEAMASAQQMLRQGNPDSAVQFLEAKIPELSDVRLSNLLEDARRQKDQFQRDYAVRWSKPSASCKITGQWKPPNILRSNRSATAKLQNFGLSPTLL